MIIELYKQTNTNQNKNKMKKNLLLAIIAIIFCAIISQAQNVPSYVSTNALVGWWSFTGNAKDSSGHGFNGTDRKSTRLNSSHRT